MDCFVTSFLAMTSAVIRLRSVTGCTRHCEPEAKQSKDVQQLLGMDCFVTSFLAMTDVVIRLRSVTVRTRHCLCLTRESYPKNQKILPKKSPQAGKIVGLTAKNLKGYRNLRKFSKKNNFSLTKKKKNVNLTYNISRCTNNLHLLDKGVI